MFFESGAMKNGIFRWDGTNLRTVVQTDDDLPGSLGGFTGQPGRYQIAFDGQNVGFIASANIQGKGPYGMYRAGPDGVLTKLIDGNDKHPAQNGLKTYFQRNAPFVNLDLDGPNSFLGVYEMVSAAGTGNSFYMPGIRFTGGTMNVATATFGDDGNPEVLLPYPDGINPPKIDGKALAGITMVDGHGEDVALLLRLEDGTQGIYAAIGTRIQPPAPLVLATPTLANGMVSLRFPSVLNQSYRIEFIGSLTDTNWALRAELKGNGAELQFQEPLSASGFYRVIQAP
jgi:hypothetical protein